MRKSRIAVLLAVIATGMNGSSTIVLANTDNSVKEKQSGIEIGMEPLSFHPEEGLVKNDHEAVFYDAQGWPESGWHTVDGKTYYFSTDDYYALTGEQTIEGTKYFFDENGVLDEDWVEETETEKTAEAAADTASAAETETAAESTSASAAASSASAAASTSTSTSASSASAARTASSGQTSSQAAAQQSTAAAAQQQTQTQVQTAPSVPYDTANLGSAGNLSIPGLGIDVALNYVNMADASVNPQAVVNAGNSAALMSGFAVPVIADHAYQGFSALASAYGQTAYIYNGSSATAYVCTGVYAGVNTGSDLLVNGQSVLYSAPGALVMYTCQSTDGVNVYVSIWNYA